MFPELVNCDGMGVNDRLVEVVVIMPFVSTFLILLFPD